MVGDRLSSIHDTQKLQRRRQSFFRLRRPGFTRPTPLLGNGAGVEEISIIVHRLLVSQTTCIYLFHFFLLFCFSRRGFLLFHSPWLEIFVNAFIRDAHSSPLASPNPSVFIPSDIFRLFSAWAAFSLFSRLCVAPFVFARYPFSPFDFKWRIKPVWRDMTSWYYTAFPLLPSILDYSSPSFLPSNVNRTMEPFDSVFYCLYRLCALNPETEMKCLADDCLIRIREYIFADRFGLGCRSIVKLE